MSEHILITPKDCGCNPEMGNCPICDGGLAVCKVCGKAEVELDEPCRPDRDPDHLNPAEDARRPCKFCNGTGKVHASREMAIDAGDLQLEGSTITCWFCKGDGFVFDEHGRDEQQ